MGKKLMIVESPAKAKTIEKYLGGEFLVKSSYGHIRDLDKGKKGIDIDDDFKPNYVVSPEKKKVVKELQSLCKNSEEVWLATDEDREGEAISWHLCEVLGLDPKVTKRIVFNEITKPAIQKAIQSPRTVDINLVDAQQARRILDRLVGFELSELLWRKVRNKLSAGRVQSVAVKLIVERERDIQGFDSKPYFKASVLFVVKGVNGQNAELKAEYQHRMATEEEALNLLGQCAKGVFTIRGIEKKPLNRKPAAPFITSTLQQEASRKMGFAVNRTMSTAQRLYEKGHITYMRTDSTNLSDTALGQIGNKIESDYGEEYVNIRKFKSKDASAQEAHEAIRPTYIEKTEAGDTTDESRLYDLIWKRTIASQMAEARIEKTLVSIENSQVRDGIFKAEGEVLLFDGFLKVYLESTDDEEEEAKGMLPPLTEGQVLDLKSLVALERNTRPPSRYTEASLVKKLEELGIGRPSTYAPTITKIMEAGRGYVTKESRPGEPKVFKRFELDPEGRIQSSTITEMSGKTSNRLYASDIGMVVSDFLQEHFASIMEYSFTAQIEEKFDIIADGKASWRQMVGGFYEPFHNAIVETMDNAERAKGRRELGVDPVSGHTVLAQMSRFGPLVQIGTREEVGEEGKPRFANLQPGQSLETISFEEAMELFKLPRQLGTYEGEEVEVNSGRYGPYVKWSGKFVNMGRELDPLKIGLEEAIELIKIKQKEDAPIGTYESLPITKGKGRFGPFVKWNNLFVNIPKRFDPELLTVEEAVELIKIKVQKEANRYVHNWPELDLSVQNGRWGPFIKFKKKNISFPKTDGKRLTSEEAAELSLEEVQALVETEVPGAFKKKAAKGKKKTTASK
jgi:DNA topoisomerase-1